MHTENVNSGSLRRTIATVMVAALIVLAGCSAGGGGTPATPGEETPTPETATDATNPDTDSGTPTETSTPAPTFAQDHTNESGYFTIEEVNMAGEEKHLLEHREQARNLDTYQFRMEWSVPGKTETVTFKYGETASYRITNHTHPSTEHEYMDRDAGTTVTHSVWETDGETTTSTSSEVVGADQTLVILPTHIAGYKFDHYKEEGGTTYAVFAATGSERLFEDRPDAETASGELVMSETGLIKKATLYAEDSNGEVVYSFEYEFSGINSTTVTTPDWASDE